MPEQENYFVLEINSQSKWQKVVFHDALTGESIDIDQWLAKKLGYESDGRYLIKIEASAIEFRRQEVKPIEAAPVDEVDVGDSVEFAA